MILRITVKDNDFQDILEKFCMYVAGGQHDPGPEPLRNTPEYDAWVRQYVKEHQAYLEALRKTYRESTAEDRRFVCRIVRDTWIGWLESYQTIERKTKAYLKENFECSVAANVTDKWHNSEVFYVFPTSGTARPVLNF